MTPEKYKKDDVVNGGVDGFRCQQEKEWYATYFANAARKLVVHLPVLVSEIPVEAIAHFRRHKWLDFMLTSLPVNQNLVRLFYASLVYVPKSTLNPTPYWSAYVRGTKVNFTRKILNSYLGNMKDPDHFNRLTDQYAYPPLKLTQHLDPTSEGKEVAFKAISMSELNRVIHHINIHTFMVTNNRSEVCAKHAAFIYALVTNVEHINMPDFFLNWMTDVAFDMKEKSFLPLGGVVTKLCIAAGCPVYDSDSQVSPLSAIGSNNIKKILSYKDSRVPQIAPQSPQPKRRRVESSRVVVGDDEKAAQHVPMMDEQWRAQIAEIMAGQIRDRQVADERWGIIQEHLAMAARDRELQAVDRQQQRERWDTMQLYLDRQESRWDSMHERIQNLSLYSGPQDSSAPGSYRQL